jgi:hypothetical protein
MDRIAIRQKMPERKARKNDQKNEHEIGQEGHGMRYDGNYMRHRWNVLAELEHFNPRYDAVNGKDAGVLSNPERWVFKPAAASSGCNAIQMTGSVNARDVLVIGYWKLDVASE